MNIKHKKYISRLIRTERKIFNYKISMFFVFLSLILKQFKIKVEITFEIKKKKKRNYIYINIINIYMPNE